jgi:hypothetical protein
VKLPAEALIRARVERHATNLRQANFDVRGIIAPGKRIMALSKVKQA